MRIESVRYENGELILSASPDARKLVYGFKAGDYELTKVKRKRSLDANAYSWLLIGKIAAAVGVPDIEIYRNAVAQIGGTAEIVCCTRKAADSLKRHWLSGHLGRDAQEMPSKVPGCVNVRLAYGSSDFDKAEMTKLIDNLIQDCKSLGIEYKPQWEIDSLLEAWA